MTVKITSFLPSMPSYSTNMITSRRDHPFNKSTRPLLMERKPQLLLKKKIINFNDNNSISNVNSNINGNGSTKMHHGFNDFDDIMSQQFNRNLNTHIGYPYGSPPPSPTTINSNNDFRFSDDITNNGINNLGISSINSYTDNNYQNLNQNNHHQQQQQQQQQQQKQNQIESLPKPYPPSACDEDNFFPNDNQTLPISNRITEQFSNWNINNRRQNKQNQHHQYENQFSSRNYHNNSQHQQQHNKFQSNYQNGNINNKNYDDHDHDNTNDNNYDDINNYENSGPFIFGVHDTTNHNFKNIKSNNSTTTTTITTNNIRNNNTTVIKSNRRNFFNKIKKDKTVVFNQTNSDTSSSSKEGDKESKFLVKCRKKLSKRDHTDNNKNKQGKEKYQPNIKCVLVGDGAVGKTNLIVSYLENRFIAEHVPTASDIYNAEVMVNDNPVDVCLCDTAGQDTLDPLRELCYPDSDVFLLCFSVVKPDTFNSIKIKWAPKFSKSKAALILVGTQADLRSDIHVLNKLQTQGEKPISFTDACDFATSIGSKYIETSSLTQDKIKDVFDAAIWDALLPNHLPPKPPLWKRLLCLA